MKLIDLHWEWMEKGTIGCPKEHFGGLCNALQSKYTDMLRRFWPDNYKTFWAYGKQGNYSYDRHAYEYTPLRQTIVLFICAMAGEI